MKIAINSPPGCVPPYWDGADAVIRHGFINLFHKYMDNEIVWCYAHENINWKENVQKEHTCYITDIRPFDQQIEEVSQCDVYIKAGTPAWYNPSDQYLYQLCMSNNIPMALVGVGVGSKWRWDGWEGFKKNEDFLKQFLSDDNLKLLIARDPNCFSLFSEYTTKNSHLMTCPGYFCNPNFRIRTEKKIIAFEILNIGCLAGHCQYSEEQVDMYYSSNKILIEKLRNLGYEVKLFCARRQSTEIIEGNLHPQVINPNQISDMGYLKFQYPILWEKYFNVEESIFCSTHEAFCEFLDSVDVMIAARVHCVIPAAGCGIPSYGIGIDLRQFTWNTIPFIEKQDIRTNSFDCGKIVNWVENLDSEDISKIYLNHRERTEIVYEKYIDEFTEIL